jgi:hypothetical protein
MKRFRLSTLMLLIVVAALATALVVQSDRAARREAELRSRISKLEAIDTMIQLHEANERRWQYGPRGDEANERHPTIEPMEVVERGKR